MHRLNVMGLPVSDGTQPQYINTSFPLERPKIRTSVDEELTHRIVHIATVDTTSEEPFLAVILTAVLM